MDPQSDKSGDVYARFVERYKDHRLLFVRKVLGLWPEHWQAQALASLDKGQTRIAIRSGHGVGKSAFLSWVVLHFMITRFPQKTVVTAPTSGQLFDALAAEVKHWINLLPEPLKELFEQKAERIELRAAPADSFVAYRTSRQEQPEALQGVHADNVLLVADEASGIPDAVYQAAGGSLSTSGAIFLLAGNPTRAEGYFYNIFQKRDPMWDFYTIPCSQSSRVDPTYVRMIADQYGKDSNVYRVRCLGEFPLFDEDKLIPLDLIETSIGRDIAILPAWQTVWGLDVARGNNDRTALVKRRGRVVQDVQVRRFTDLMQLCGWVKREYDDAEPDEKPYEIYIDSIGLGAGVADRLSELNLPAVGINVAEVSAMSPEAYRLRDDLWIQCRDWFRRKDVSIPDNPDLVRDLSAPTFSFNSAGKLKCASKDEMKRKGFASPDIGDALCLSFAGDGAVALLGSDKANSAWNKPLDIPRVAYV